MGIRLVGYALSPNWSHLSERARLVLAQMCYMQPNDIVTRIEFRYLDQGGEQP